MSARIPPADHPYSEDVQKQFDKIMPKGRTPLVLFTTLARDPRLLRRFFSGGLLGPGNLTLRNREIVIDRITALSNSEYEWGVHVALFGESVGFSEDQVASTVRGNAADPCWSAEESALIAACDQLHATCDLDDAAWNNLKSHFTDEAIIEILMLAGQYRMVSYLTNAMRLPIEPFAGRFPGS